MSGVGLTGLSDANKGMLNFNIQGTNAAKVISNRPGISVLGNIQSQIPDVGVYGSNPNLAAGG